MGTSFPDRTRFFMPGLAYSQHQRLEVVSLRKQRLDDARRSAEVALRAQVADVTSSLRAEYENAVLDAVSSGVPNSQIARAVGTSNPKPIREIIRKAASARRSSMNDRYMLGDESDKILVWLDGDDLKSACESTGWSVVEAVANGVDRATFRVTPESVMVAVTPSFVLSAGRLHPVVAFVRRYGAPEVLAWWKQAH